jgi:uncharacterized protein (TIGR03089 family)
VTEIPATPPWASLADLLEWGIAQDPARPYLTYYDDITNERVELSFKTFGNWVAKTSHLLREAGAEHPGARVAVWLPSHWQSVVVLAATWALGGTVVVVGGLEELLGTGVDVTVVAEERLSALIARRAEATGLGTVVALSLRPMGAGMVAPRAGVVDFADEVVAQPDDLLRDGSLDDLAIDVGDQRLTGRELVVLAADVVAAQQLGRADRCLALVGSGLADDGLVVGSLACFVAGAGLVLCLGLRPSDLPSRAAHEQVTVLAAPVGWVARAAEAPAGLGGTRLRTVLARGDGECADTLLGAPVTRV